MGNRVLEHRVVSGYSLHRGGGQEPLTLREAGMWLAALSPGKVSRSASAWVTCAIMALGNLSPGRHQLVYSPETDLAVSVLIFPDPPEQIW